MRKIMFALACILIGWTFFAYTVIPPKPQTYLHQALKGATDAYLLLPKAVSTHVSAEDPVMFQTFPTKQERMYYIQGFVITILSMFTLFFFCRTHPKKDQ